MISVLFAGRLQPTSPTSGSDPDTSCVYFGIKFSGLSPIKNWPKKVIRPRKVDFLVHVHQ